MTWLDLHRQGCTARQAAEARGTGISAPYTWAKRYGYRWPRPKANAGACPVIIGGQHYDSIRLAAKALGVDPTVVVYHLDRYGHAERAGKGQKGHKTGRTPPNARQVVVGGRRYPSMSAAARDLGVSLSTVSNWLQGRYRNTAEALMNAAMRRDHG